ncbi:MAG: ABC transporter permease [Lachnospiraceae bacterium]|nr:ABC transporter permease [Lachnospiraceae bacterium]MDY5742875.1 ABC transporter permease [Lachnospiraceae bacterium]
MGKFLVKRFLNLIPVLIILSILFFSLMKAMPGDPVRLMMPNDPKIVQDKKTYDRIYRQTAERYGFDKSLPEQYLNWVKRTVTGDLGYSTQYKKPVKDVIGTPLKNTLFLNLGSTIIGFFISLLIGIRSAVKKGSFYDRFWQVMSLVGISLPTFFVGMMLIFIFALKLKWLPAGGMPVKSSGDAGYLLEWLRILIMPTITLTVGQVASTSRYVRNAMLDSLSQDYIRTARSKGLKEKVVIYRHAFRNALIPVVTVVAWSLVGMFSGAAITETVFAYNGIGKVLISAVLAVDYNVALAMNTLFALLTVVGNLLMDVGYALVDPRVRLN